MHLICALHAPDVRSACTRCVSQIHIHTLIMYTMLLKMYLIYVLHVHNDYPTGVHTVHASSTYITCARNTCNTYSATHNFGITQHTRRETLYIPYLSDWFLVRLFSCCPDFNITIYFHLMQRTTNVISVTFICSQNEKLDSHLSFHFLFFSFFILRIFIRAKKPPVFLQAVQW